MIDYIAKYALSSIPLELRGKKKNEKYTIQYNDVYTVNRIKIRKKKGGGLETDKSSTRQCMI